MPKKKSDYTIRKLSGLVSKFSSVDDLKREVVHICKDTISEDMMFGYIEPGHGANQLMTNDDLKDMYRVFNGKKEILLWSCHPAEVQGKRSYTAKRTNDESDTSKRSRYDKYLDVITEVEEIEEDLRQKHIDSGIYSEDQLRSWAHLIQMKKHTSFEVPPNKGFLKSSRQKRNQVVVQIVMVLKAPMHVVLVLRINA